MKTPLLLFFLGQLLLNFNLALATEDEKILSPSEINLPSGPVNNTKISPDEAYLRSTAVLEHFAVEVEPDFAPELFNYQGIQTLSQFVNIKKILDPLDMISRTANFNQDLISLYKDSDSKKIHEYSVNFMTSNQNVEYFQFYKNLQIASKNKANQQLKGLKIAIDPGHMGDSFWDNETGKYVRDKKGTYISEGVINLQTALLVKESLEKHGAQVLITHDYLGPVTSVPYDKFDVKFYARNELRDSIYQDWFANLLTVAPIGKNLFNAFENSPQVKNLFSNSKRADYFIKREDLDARINIINNFEPDITIIIHYDSNDPADDPNGLNPNTPQGTKAFVIGNYEKTELSSRTQRFQFTKHALDQQSWDASLALTKYVVQGMSQSLSIPLTKSGGPSSLKIDDGIFARNLLIPRKLNPSAVSYLECLFYNEPKEFYSLAKRTNPMYINGKYYPYSDRLLDVAKGIETGITQFVKSFSEASDSL